MKQAVKMGLALGLLASVGTTARGDRVDDYLRTEMKKRHIPGLAVAVLRDGKVQKIGAYGLANVELKAPVTRKTLFQIQSVTKQFVAMAVVLLAEEGKLGLDDPIGKYLEGTPDTWKPVTLRHLLTHTSGIRDFINQPTASLRLDVTEEEVLRATAPRPLNFPVGERYAYSNTGYHLLGMVIHKVTGKPWAEFVRERVTEPAGMTSTRVYSHSDIFPNRAAGYTWTADGVRNGQYIAPSILAYAGGGLQSTIEDMAKWDIALTRNKIVSEETLESIYTSGTLNNGKPAGYGFGWNVGANNGHRFAAHGGSHMTGFQSQITRYLDDRLTIIVLANLQGANPSSLVQGVAHLYEPGIHAASFLDPAPDPNPKVTQNIRTFLADMAAGRKESAGAVPAFARDLDDDDRGQLTANVKAMGDLQCLERVDVSAAGEVRNGARVAEIRAYRMMVGKEKWFYRFWLTADGKVADYSDRE